MTSLEEIGKCVEMSTAESITGSGVLQERGYTLAGKLYNVMREKKLTFTKIARETGLEESLVKNIFHSKMRPSKYVLERLATSKSLNLTYKTLITWCLLDGFIP